MNDAPPLAARGLGEDATPEATREAAARLRQHIEARAAASSDPAFVRARNAELAGLDALLRLGHAGPLVGAAGSAVTPWLIAWAVGATLACLGLVAILVLRDASTPPPAAVEAPAVARVRVDAEPTSAEVVLLAGDAARVVARGEGADNAFEVPPGEYTLRVSDADCPDEWNRAVVLEPGSTSEYAPRICVGTGEVVVRSNVAGDRLQIDGVDVGSTGATAHALGVGRHQVTITKAGFGAWTGEVRIGPGDALTLNAELAPEPGAAPDAADAAARNQAQPVPQRTQPPAPTPAPDDFAAVGVEDGAAVDEEASSERGARRGGGAEPTRTRGGSKSWHDAVRQRLVSEYDRNQSRTLDTSEEIRSIPCQVWRSIEASYEAGGLGVTMTRLYGFDGSEAPANTLGVTHEMRGYAYDRMTGCGLKKGG